MRKSVIFYVIVHKKSVLHLCISFKKNERMDESIDFLRRVLYIYFSESKHYALRYFAGRKTG